jgi:hypothetical protein
MPEYAWGLGCEPSLEPDDEYDDWGYCDENPWEEFDIQDYIDKYGSGY